jgi:hypothetical protein
MISYMRQKVEWLVLSLFVSGFVAMIAGFLGFFYPVISFVLLAPIFFLSLIILEVLKVFSKISRIEKWLAGVLGVIWLMHFSGVLVPETGFDAVWYHLPIIQLFVQHHHVYYISGFYQSVNPLFSDLVFGLGFLVAGEVGAKLVAFLFGITLILVTYSLSRELLNRFWSLVIVIFVSLFQVVTWQSSSFYIDIAKAVWEVAAVWMLVKWSMGEEKKLRESALLFGASLASKLFSVLLLPFFAVSTFLQKPDLKKTLLFTLLSLIIAAPFYVFAYKNVGTPFYAVGVHTEKLAQIGGQQNPILYVVTRTVALPSSLTTLTLFSRDYTSLVFLVFISIFVMALPQIWQDKKLKGLCIFALGQWLVWWYVPPLSSRYALSGFIILMILFIWSIQKFVTEKPEAKKYIFVTLAILVVVNLLPRVLVTKRNLEYILGRKSKVEYLKQFYDGSIDTNLKKWHHI